MKTLTILIYIDQASRDSYGMSRIGKAIEEVFPAGTKVYYCSALNVRIAFDRFNPDVVVMGNVDVYHGDHARYFHARGAKIFSLPTEQLIDADDLKVKRICAGHDLGHGSAFKRPALDEVSRFYFWGSDYFRVMQ